MTNENQSQQAFPDPFALPARVRQTLRSLAERREGFNVERVRYLWLHLSGEEAHGQKEERKRLSVEEWLNVVDEAAALGVRTVIISSGAPLAEMPEVWEICDWAQNTHDMVVGIYLFGDGLPIGDGEVEAFKRLNQEQTHLFIEQEHFDKAAAVQSVGIPIHNADIFRNNSNKAICELPHTMTCVGAEGNLYTCGLVLGEEDFRLGNVCAERLDNVLEDESLPHEIPGEVERKPRCCNACPPLMEKYLRQRDQERKANR